MLSIGGEEVENAGPENERPNEGPFSLRELN